MGWTRSGEKVSNWKEKLKSGSQAGSNYSLDLLDGQLNPGSASQTAVYKTQSNPDQYASFTSTFSGNYFAPDLQYLNLYGGFPFSEVDNTALARAHSRVRQQTSAFNSLVAGGELRETIRMLKRPFSAVRDLVNSYLDSAYNMKRKSRNLDRALGRRAFTKALSGTWLEVAFGLKPLLSDAKELALAIAKHRYEPPQTARVRAFASKRLTDTIVTTPSILNPTVNTYIKYFTREEYEYEYSCQYIVGMASTQRAAFGSADRLVQLLGFTPENFVPALWELAPWSFLVDYFTNIGDIIEASTTNQTDVQWHVKTTQNKTRKTQVTPTLDSTEYLASFQYRNGGGGGDLGGYTLVRKSLTRTVGGKLGVPTLELSIPESGGKIANMLALFAQKASRVDPRNSPLILRNGF